MVKNNIVILGSTGSIGTGAVDVAKHLNHSISVTGLVAGSNAKLLVKQAHELNCNWIAIADETKLDFVKQHLPDNCSLIDYNTISDHVTNEEVDTVLCAIVGTSGFKPVLNAIKAGKTIALASKEILVMAGELVMAEAQKSGSKIIPVDSEHSAIFQCIQGESFRKVNRLIITASGGPFRNTPAEDFKNITVEQALKHPTWNMGRKISIDSATMMNKGLELIEACRLFPIKADNIEVVIHPQSIIHSMVEFADGSILAQVGNPDMRLPIQYALTYPERVPGITETMDFSKCWDLSFSPPNEILFPALKLAKLAAQKGGTLPVVFNAANEVAVEKFLEEKISFLEITSLVENMMLNHQLINAPDLPTILQVEKQTKLETEALI